MNADKVCPECKGPHVQDCGFGQLTCMDCQWVSAPIPAPGQQGPYITFMDHGVQYIKKLKGTVEPFGTIEFGMKDTRLDSWVMVANHVYAEGLSTQVD